jgi:RecB family endonuclease NucS
MLKLEDYSMLLDNAIKKNQSIVFGCRCDINYSGRAESFLSEGDRIIIIKEDNALIIHQPTGNNPVNYMKPGSAHSVMFEEGSCWMSSRNMTTKEFMKINISRIYFFQSYKMQDGQAIELKGTEKDMADMIMKNPSIIEKGFKPLSMEEQTKYGFIDILGYDKENTLTVVECKRYVADLAAVTQLRRYVEKIKASKGLTFVKGILAAPKISSNAQGMLEDWGYKFVEVKPPKYLEKFDKSQQRLHQFA